MNDQVVVGPNGDLAIAVPLFRIQETQAVDVFPEYTLSFTAKDPIAYAVDLGEGSLHLVNAEMLEKKVTFLGDL